MERITVTIEFKILLSMIIFYIFITTAAGFRVKRRTPISIGNKTVHEISMVLRNILHIDNITYSSRNTLRDRRFFYQKSLAETLQSLSCL